MKAILLRYHRTITIGVQVMLIVAANYAAFMLRFDANVPCWAMQAWWQMLPWLVVIRVVTFVPFRLYEGLWRYTSIWDLPATSWRRSPPAPLVFFLVIADPVRAERLPALDLHHRRGAAHRCSGRRPADRRLARASCVTASRGKRVLIFGAGDAGEMIVRDMKTTRPSTTASRSASWTTTGGRSASGSTACRCSAPAQDLPRDLERHRPDEVLIAMPTADAATIRGIVQGARAVQAPDQDAAEPARRHGRQGVGRARSGTWPIEDLLPRAPVGLDPAPVQQLIAGQPRAGDRRRRLDRLGAVPADRCRSARAALVLFERYENSLFAIANDLRDRGTRVRHPRRHRRHDRPARAWTR